MMGMLSQGGRPRGERFHRLWSVLGGICLLGALGPLALATPAPEVTLAPGPEALSPIYERSSSEASPPPRALEGLGAMELLKKNAYLEVKPDQWPTLCLYYLVDHQAVFALELAEALVASEPASIVNRWLRLEALALGDPWGFVAAQSAADPSYPFRGLHSAPREAEGGARFRRVVDPVPLPSLDEPGLARLEGLLALYIRLRIERAGYRGDGVEEPDGFIARMESLQSTLSEALDSAAPFGPLGDLIRFEVAFWQGDEQAQGAVVNSEGWLQGEAEGDRVGVIPYFLVTLPKRSVPVTGSALASLESDAPYPWRLSAQIDKADREVRDVHWSERLGLYEGLLTQAQFPFDDDLHLAIAREMMISQSPEVEDLKPHFNEVFSRGYRNSTPKAVRSYAASGEGGKTAAGRIGVYRTYNESLKQPPNRAPWGKPILRQLGRALVDEGQHQEALLVLNELLESRWGESRDYLYLADATRVVTGPKDALTLLDFATAVQERKLAVEAWRQGWGPEITAMKFRLFEFGASARHWVLFPRTFIALGGLFLMDGVLLGLCLVLFAGLPRISRKGWSLGLITGGLALCLQGSAALAGVPMPMGWAGEGAWVLYGALRSFLLGAGAGILALHIRTPGFSLWRRGKRALKRRSPGFLGEPLLGLALGMGGCLLLMALLDGGGEASSYLERLPGAIAAGSLLGGAEGSLPLTLSGALWTELLVRGGLLGLVGVGVRRLSLSPGIGWALGILGLSVCWSVVMAGVGEDVSLRMAFLMGEGVVLGSVAVRYGLDVAILSQLGAQLAAHFGGLN